MPCGGHVIVIGRRPPWLGRSKGRALCKNFGFCSKFDGRILRGQEKIFKIPQVPCGHRRGSGGWCIPAEVAPTWVRCWPCGWGEDLACVAPRGLSDGHVAAGSFSWEHTLVGPAQAVAVVL